MDPDARTLVQRACGYGMLNTSAAQEAEEKQCISSGLIREVIRRFRDEGLTLRDIASLVGLSQQRVAVLSKDV